MRDLVRAEPSAKLGSKMVVNWREIFWLVVTGEKKVLRKAYSKEALSMRAMLKDRKEVSRKC